MTDTILITGGAGFIGSAFTAQCVSRGMHALVLDKLTYAGHRANLEWINSREGGNPCRSGSNVDPRRRGDVGYTLIEGDIADAALVARLLSEHKPRAIVHFAAESHVDNSITGPQAFIDTNITGTYQLLHSALAYYRALSPTGQNDFRFLHVSTDEVYGSLPLNGGHFTEDSPYRPNSPYSASKAAGDHLARAWWKTYGLPVVTTHCSNNYGPRQHPEKLIPRMIACALSGEKLPVYGEGKNVRDWIHVEDHCNGLWLALEKGKTGEIYNFGGRAEIDNLTLVKQLCGILDTLHPRTGGAPYAGLISFVKDRPGHDLRYAIDDAKAERELGFTRAYDFARGLETTARWYLENQEWCRKVLDER